MRQKAAWDTPRGFFAGKETARYNDTSIFAEVFYRNDRR
jgi:hypothetical protein